MNPFTFSGVELNTLILLGVAVLSSFNVFYTRKTEKNTNSMKDALVAATSKASLLEGHASGLAQGRAEPRPDK